VSRLTAFVEVLFLVVRRHAFEIYR
jgi:hypothetical protein